MKVLELQTFNINELSKDIIFDKFNGLHYTSEYFQKVNSKWFAIYNWIESFFCNFSDPRHDGLRISCKSGLFDITGNKEKVIKKDIGKINIELNKIRCENIWSEQAGETFTKRMEYIYSIVDDTVKTSSYDDLFDIVVSLVTSVIEDLNVTLIHETVNKIKEEHKFDNNLYNLDGNIIRIPSRKV